MRLYKRKLTVAGFRDFVLRRCAAVTDGGKTGLTPDAWVTEVTS